MHNTVFTSTTTLRHFWGKAIPISLDVNVRLQSDMIKMMR